MAARDNGVLVGRASTVILRDVRHALRVRVIASEYVRAQRIERQHGLTAEAALESVRHADHDLGARVRFLYHLDWEAPLLYDVVLTPSGWACLAPSPCSARCSRMSGSRPRTTRARSCAIAA